MNQHNLELERLLATANSNQYCPELLRLIKAGGTPSVRRGVKYPMGVIAAFGTQSQIEELIAIIRSQDRKLNFSTYMKDKAEHPLSIAIKHGNLDTTKVLLKYGKANSAPLINIYKDGYKLNPSIYQQILHLLVDHGWDINKTIVIGKNKVNILSMHITDNPDTLSLATAEIVVNNFMDKLSLATISDAKNHLEKLLADPTIGPAHKTDLESAMPLLEKALAEKQENMAITITEETIIESPETLPKSTTQKPFLKRLNLARIPLLILSHISRPGSKMIDFLISKLKRYKNNIISRFLYRTAKTRPKKLMITTI
jgi:hypothetical protein